MKRRDLLRTLALAPISRRLGAALAGAPAAIEANAIDAYRAAIARLPTIKVTPAARTLRAVMDVDLDPSAAALVRRGRAALEELARGARSTRCEWGDDWTSVNFSAAVETWIIPGCRVAALALLRARFAFEAGEAWHTRAVDDLLAALALARRFGQAGVVLAQAAGFWIEHKTVEVAASRLVDLAPSRLEEISRRIDALPRRADLATVIRAEREFTLGYVRLTNPAEFHSPENARRLAGCDRALFAADAGADDAAILDALDESPDGAITGFRNGRRYIDVKHTMLRAAIARLLDGAAAAANVADPADGAPFNVEETPGGFALSSRLTMFEKPVRLVCGRPRTPS